MTTFFLDGQALLLAPELERDLRGLGHEPLCDPRTLAEAEVLILGEEAGLEDRVRALREDGCRAVILTLRRRRDSVRSALLIGSGADDDVLVPVPARELLARARAISRVSGRDATDRVLCFGVSVFPDGRAPEVSGSPLPLSVQEGRILSHLALNQGRFVPRAALISALSASQDHPPSDRVVDVHVCNVRRKLQAAMGETAPRILTGRGQGYRLGPPAPEGGGRARRRGGAG